MQSSNTSKLSEVVGALVASIAYARSVADNSSLRIADLYGKNELLKGLPVPRLRIQRVSISLPVMLSKVIPGKEAEYGDVENICENICKRLIDGISWLHLDIEAHKQLKHLDEDAKKEDEIAQLVLQSWPTNGDNKDAISLIDVFAREFGAGLKEKFSDLAHPKGNSYDERGQSDAFLRDCVAKVAEDSLRIALKEAMFGGLKKKHAAAFSEERARNSFGHLLASSRIGQLITYIRRSAEEFAVASPTIPPDLEVLVDTNTIKSCGGGADTITRVNMVLLEEGLEWVDDAQGGSGTRLVPE